MNIRVLLAVAASSIFVQWTASAEEALSGADAPYTVEYLYRIKWGHFDEWIELYKKNHWPVLVAEMERGHILDIRIDQPHNLAPETHRWDIRVAITWKNVVMAHHLVDRDREGIYGRLYPNRKKWEKEEQRRFKLLDGLQTVETFQLDTNKWPTGAQN